MGWLVWLILFQLVDWEKELWKLRRRKSPTSVQENRKKNLQISQRTKAVRYEMMNYKVRLVGISWYLVSIYGETGWYLVVLG